MAKDFSNPKKLGFLRVIQVLFAINVLMSLVSLTFYIKGSYVIDFEEGLDMLNLIFDAVSFWLIWNRKRVTRY